jgi:formate/nitrite transporter FocA (FNT family)
MDAFGGGNGRGHEKHGAAAAAEEMPAERREAVENQTRPNALIIHETIRLEGEDELARSVTALLLSGFAAGLTMGFSLVAEGLLHAHLPKAPWRELVSSWGYTFGFLIVVLGRQQLFTENTLTPILPLLYNRDAATLRRVLRLWIVVLAANIAGTFVFAYAITQTDVFGTEIKAAFAEISRPVIAFPFWTTLLKGVFAAWLIALMAWLMPAAEAARPFIIMIATYVVALGGFAHIVAGSIDAAYLIQIGEAGWTDYVTRFFVPTLIGNVLGGVTLVAMLNYGQVAPEIDA